MKQIAGGRRLILLVALIAALMTVAIRPDGTSAHPLGNFTVNQYSRIEATETGLRLVYVLDLAEIPAFQEIEAADADGNGTIDDAERARYLDEKIEEITPNLHLAVDEQELTLTVVERDVTFPEGQAGLKLVRLRAVLAPAAPILSAAPRAVTYQNDYAADRLGWREIVVSHGAGIRLDGSDAPATDASDELRAYPEDLLSSPLDRSRARFSLALAPGAAAADGFEHFASAGQTATDANQARPGGGAAGARFASLIDEGNLTAAGIVVALLAAMLWGAMHALSPGHGKTVVGAYLVGSRGTARHAAFLGLTVTVTHTAGVLMVGLVTLFASHFIVPERLYPWMSVVSGALVVVMGTTIFWRRLRGRPTFGHHHDHDHHHDHEHDPDHEHADHHHHDHGGHGHSHLPPGADSAPVTWRALLALGVSGGLIPCPSALVVLLGSIALGRVGFGLALVIAFSLGLAATLTGVGLLFLYAGRLIERRIASKPWMGLLMRFAPAGGALALTLAGLAIIVRALGETGLR